MVRTLVASQPDARSIEDASANLTYNLRCEVLPQDRTAVRALVERTGFFNRHEVDIAVELVDARLSDGVASGYEFVFADLDGALAGYACYGSIPCTEASFDLYWIAVEPAVQRLGVGRTLMEAVESQIAARGGKRIYIDTSGRDQYRPTRAFYERSGYYCEARLADFYAPGDDRVIYVKPLTKIG
jgi:ribosomal protein S18 acetylase RimI-like enzyme